MKHQGLLAVSVAALVASAAGCKNDAGEPPGPGLMGTTLFFPYPSMHLMEQDAASATGHRVSIPEGVIPVATDGTPMPVHRFNELDGFSPATPCLVLFEGVDIDPDTVPGQDRIETTVEPDSAVQIIDLATGERHPLMAELDSQPDAIEEHRRVLIVRPMRMMEWGSRYAVVLTDGLETMDGEPVPRPAGFDALVKGRNVPGPLESWQDHYDELFATLEGHGVDMDRVVLAWDFWTNTREVNHASLQVILDGTEADIPSDPDFVPDYTVRTSRTIDSDVDEGVDPLIWRHAEIEFSMVTYVDGNGEFVLDESGLPTPQGRDDYLLIIHVPPSVHGAAAGTVPVVIIGHGLLGMPDDYLTRTPNSLKALEYSDHLGMIFVAAEWRGLSMRDTLDAATAATDFGKFHRVTDELHMGVANFLAVARMMEGGFAGEPFFTAADESGSLVDTDRIYYMGISLGGHQGGVVMALSSVIDFGILQVGGAPWTTMLERSSNWHEYTIIIDSFVRDPVDRQMLYAASQMLWDPVDPATHYEALRSRSVLMQESVGDAQVPNMSTEFWARSVGLSLVGPAPRHPAFIDEVPGPVGPHGSALFIYDAMASGTCGEMPPEGNIPAEDNCAHGIIRKTQAHVEQMEAFFAMDADPSTAGTIIHPPDCGTSPCLPVP